MRFQSFFILAFIFFIAVSVATSCYQKPEFANAPMISNPVLTSSVIVDCTLVKSDIVRIKVDFQDGDGDLGLNASDNQAPFNEPRAGETNFYYTNYKLKVFRQQGTTFVPFTLPDPNLTYDQRFPRLGEPNRVSPIQGTLSNRVAFVQTGLAPNTVIKFRIQVIDRALNTSNEIETDTITINRR